MIRDKTQPSPEAKPKFLSGGSLQIPKGDGDAPVQAYIAAMPEWKQDIGRRCQLQKLLTGGSSDHFWKDGYPCK